MTNTPIIVFTRRRTVYRILHPFAIWLLLTALAPILAGQQSSSILDWLTTIQGIEARLRTDANANVVVELRSLHYEIAQWNSAHLQEQIDLPELPTQQMAPVDVAKHVSELPGGAFNAGQIEVNVTATALQTPTTVTLDGSDYRLRNLPEVADALNLLPGVTIQKIGPHNERGVYIRGFDFRQVPLYMNGIRIYVPYDGSVDIDQFLNYDVSEIQVSKGFTSPLYGPNAFVNAGTRFRKWWAQGGFA